jgi:two-component system, OmpR family, KDP operon response regulator KdpE
MPPRILVVDDEPTILTTMTPLLQGRGYEVATAMSGRGAIEAADRRLLRSGRTMPILVLSARGGEPQKVEALDAGADDFVTKPFGAEELLARIRVALRRVDTLPPADTPIVCGELVIDRDRRRVTRGDVEVRLTPKELELLAFLAQHPDRVLTHRALLKAVWGPHAVDQPEHLRVLVKSLRKKIEPDPSRPRYILTEPWVGYRFVAAAEPSA